MKPSWIGPTACLLGAATVAIGAFAAHGLRDHLDETALGWIETGARYQFFHVLGLLAVARLAAEGRPLARAAAVAFLAGVLFFSGSLYLMALGGPRWLGAVTPVGGVSFMAGWVLAAIAWGRLPRRDPADPAA